MGHRHSLRRRLGDVEVLDIGEARRIELLASFNFHASRLKSISLYRPLASQNTFARRKVSHTGKILLTTTSFLIALRATSGLIGDGGDGRLRVRVHCVRPEKRPRSEGYIHSAPMVSSIELNMLV